MLSVSVMVNSKKLLIQFVTIHLIFKSKMVLPGVKWMTNGIHRLSTTYARFGQTWCPGCHRLVAEQAALDV